MFIITLYGIDALYMIYLEPTRTNVVFSKITVVLFFVQKMKVLKIARNFFMIFCVTYEQCWSEEPPEEGCHGGQANRARPRPWARPDGLWGSRGSVARASSGEKSYKSQKRHK